MCYSAFGERISDAYSQYKIPARFVGRDFFLVTQPQMASWELWGAFGFPGSGMAIRRYLEEREMRFSGGCQWAVDVPPMGST